MCHKTTRSVIDMFCILSLAGPTSNTLNYANLRVITNAVCQQTFGSIIISSTICAAGITSSAQGVCSVRTPLRPNEICFVGMWTYSNNRPHRRRLSLSLEHSHYRRRPFLHHTKKKKDFFFLSINWLHN